MSWNRPKSSDLANCQKKNRCFAKWRGVGIIIAVVLLASGSVFLFRQSNSPQGSETSSIKRIKDAPKSVQRQKGRVFVAERKSERTHSTPKPEIGNAEIFFENQRKKEGKIVIWEVKNPPVFTNRFEGYVADILTTEPGERILDESLDESFDDDFREALKTPIVVSENDSEEVAELKRAVLATTEEVRQRVAKGESPRDIVLDSIKELNKIADYRDQIQAAFNEYILEARDPKELVKYEQEANAILDEYGAQHIEGPHDEATAYEVMVDAKEEKIAELSKKTSEAEKGKSNEKK